MPARQRTAAGWRAVPLRSAAGRAGRWRRRAALHRLPRRRRRRRVIRSRPTQCHPPCRPAPPGRGPGPARRPQKGRPRGTRHGRGPRRGAAAPTRDRGGPAEPRLREPRFPERTGRGPVPACGALILPNGPERGLIPACGAPILPNGPERGLVPACGTWWARRNRARRAAAAQEPGPTGRRRHEPRTGVLRRRPALRLARGRPVRAVLAGAPSREGSTGARGAGIAWGIGGAGEAAGRCVLGIPHRCSCTGCLPGYLLAVYRRST